MGEDEGNIRHTGTNRAPTAVNERDSSHQESTDNARADGSFGGNDGSPSFGDEDEEEEQQTTHCEPRQRPDETDVVDLTNEETGNANDEMHADPLPKKRARESFEALLQENVDIEGKVKEKIRYALVRVKKEVTEEANNSNLEALGEAKSAKVAAEERAEAPRGRLGSEMASGLRRRTRIATPAPLPVNSYSAFTFTSSLPSASWV